MLRTLYLSPLGWFISVLLRLLAFFKRPFMVYGARDQVSGKFRKLTRISSSAVLSDRDRIALGDNVWIWHHSIIDGSNGVAIGEGAQIGAWVGIFSHGSQIAVRIHGRDYINIPREDRTGYTRGAVAIGAYSFIGAGAMILPGVTVGKGALIGAGSVVSSDIPDFGIARGNPAKVVGDTRKLDEKYFADPQIAESYFDGEARDEWLARRKATEEAPCEGD